MYLRHPVVLTSLEEDFKKIGLLKESAADTTADPEPAPAPKKRKVSAPAEEAEEFDEDAALEEARSFAEDFDARFAANAANTFFLSEEEMEELEEMAETVVELPEGIIEHDDLEEAADDADDEEDDEDDDDDEEDEDAEESTEEDDAPIGEGKRAKTSIVGRAAVGKGRKGPLTGRPAAMAKPSGNPPAKWSKGKGVFPEDNQDEAFARLPTGGKKQAGARAYAKWKRSNPGAARKKSIRDKRYHARSAVKSRLKRLKKTSRKGFRRMAASADVPIANMLDRIEAIVGEATQTEDLQEALEAFLQISEVAEQFEQLFTDATSINEDLAEPARAFHDLALEAAEVAEALQDEDAEVDLEALEVLFQDHVTTLTDGLEAYFDLSETAEFDEAPENQGKGEHAA